MGNIFSKYFLSDFISSFRKGLINEVDKLEITDSVNVDQLKERLQAKYTIQPLVLKDVIPSEPIESHEDRPDIFGSGTFKMKVFKISITIPFDGNHELFYCSPSTSFMVSLPEAARINSNNVSATITLEELDTNKYNQKVETIISVLSSNLPRINAEITPWNNAVGNYIQQLLEQRKGLVSKKFDFMEKIGLKVNPNSSDFMIPPPIAKKIIPAPVSETSKGVKKENVPILQEEVYKDIRDVLYNVGKAVERKPSIYLNKHENDLRDIFLLFLETRYESTSGVGEAFNKKGKTDILLKYAKDGTNIFVAECKFWKGQKKLHDGLDQLLGYLTHRDSKTALILFVDQKEFSSVVKTVKDEIKNHPQFKRHIKDTYEHSINYEFSLPEDSQKVIQIEVMIFHYPSVK